MFIKCVGDLKKVCYVNIYNISSIREPKPVYAGDPEEYYEIKTIDAQDCYYYAKKTEMDKIIKRYLLDDEDGG